MSLTIPNAQIEGFNRTVLFVSQSKGTKLRGTLMEEPVVGKRGNAERISRVEMQQKTGRHADAPLISTPHSRRRVDIKDWHIRDLIDDPDRAKIAIDAETAYATNFGYAAGRKIDSEILASLNGTAVDGDGGSVAFNAGNSPSLDVTSAAVSIANLITIKTNMIQNSVDAGETFHSVIGGAALFDLLNAAGPPNVTSIDFNSVRALVEGTLTYFSGFNFHILPDELLPIFDASNRSAMFYSSMGGQLGSQINPNIRIERIAEKDATQVLMTSSFGVTRVDETRVARINHNVP